MNKQTVVKPADQTIVADDGVVCGEVRYSQIGWAIYAMIFLAPEAEGRLSRLPEVYEYTQGTPDIYVTSEEGQRSWASSFGEAMAKLAKFRREAEEARKIKAFYDELDELSAQRDELAKHLPTAHLNTLIQAAHEKLSQLGAWRNPSTLTSVDEAVRGVRNEIQRLSSGNPLEVILEAILAARLGSTSLREHNRNVLAQLELLVLRGAGEYVEVPSLDRFYREKLEAAQVSSVDAICWGDLRLRIEDYAAVTDGDPEIEWAPLEVPYPDGLVLPKNEVEPKLKVSYAYKGEGEQRQAAACVCIPFSAFNPKVTSKNKVEAREEEKARKQALITAVADGSLLPVLPHKHLKWWIRVEGKRSAEGFQGEALAVQLRNLPTR